MSGLGIGGISSVPGATPGAAYPQYNGIFFGVVNNNNDPLKKNRCLLQVPQLFGTAVTTWAISLTPLQTPPKVGTVITAMFLGGDVDFPCYLVTDPQLAVETSAGNVKPVGTASSAGSSVKYAAADHVHGNINTTNATISTVTFGSSSAAGASGALADAAHVHGMAALNLPISGGNGDVIITSGTVIGGDTASSVELQSLDFNGSITTINLNAKAINLNAPEGGVSSIHNISNLYMSPTMGVPSGYPFSTDSFTGPSWGTGERGFVNNCINAINSIVASLVSRGMMS